MESLSRSQFQALSNNGQFTHRMQKRNFGFFFQLQNLQNTKRLLTSEDLNNTGIYPKRISPGTLRWLTK